MQVIKRQFGKPFDIISRESTKMNKNMTRPIVFPQSEGREKKGGKNVTNK
jgi:hypothetical protein